MQIKNVRIQCMETYANQEYHDSMHGMAWNSANHMVPGMELHGNLMN